MASRERRLARVAHIRGVRETLRRADFARSEREAHEARRATRQLEGYLSGAARDLGAHLAEVYTTLLRPHLAAAREVEHLALTGLAVHRDALREAFRRAEKVRRAHRAAHDEVQLNTERSERLAISEIALQRWGAPSVGAQGCNDPASPPIVAPSPSSGSDRIPHRRGLASEDGTSWPS